MGDRSQFSGGYRSYSPCSSRYQQDESQDSIRYSQHTGAGNMASPSPSNPGLARFFSNSGGYPDNNFNRVPIQQVQVAQGTGHEQSASHPTGLQQTDINHVFPNQTNERGRAHPYHSTHTVRGKSTASSRRRTVQNSVGHRGTDQSRHVLSTEREARKKELVVQRRLRSEVEEVEASRRENRKPNINQKFEAITVLDTKLRKRRGFLAMFVPGMKESAVYPHLLRVLKVESQDLPPEMVQYLPLPDEGLKRASRFTNLIVEDEQYNIRATPETFRVLDHDPPVLKALIFLGKDFMDKHCHGEFPSDACSESRHENEHGNIPAASAETFESVFGEVMAADATGSWEIGVPSFQQSQNLAGAPVDTVYPGAPAPPMFPSNQPHAPQTIQGLQSPICQDVGWSSPGSGTIPSNQPSTWQPGINLNDPNRYLQSPNYGTYQYVDTTVPGVQCPEYASLDTLYPASQVPAPNHDHGSTSYGEMAFGYYQGMGSESSDKYTGYRHLQ